MNRFTVENKDLITPAISAVIKAISTGIDGGPVLIEVKRPTRNLEQNAKFHAICCDVAKQKDYMGGKRSAAQWKVLFVSGHALATGHEAIVLPGLEGEFVNIREETSKMSVKRISSLIEYVLAYCAEEGIKLTDKRHEDK